MKRDNKILITVAVASTVLGVAFYGFVQTEQITIPSEFAPGFHVLTILSNKRFDTSMSALYLFPNNATFNKAFTDYHGTVVMLIRGCSGANGTIKVYEGFQTPPPLIMTIKYHGQSLIVIAGTHTTGTDEHGNTTSESWEGMDVVAKHWRNGTWQPTNGMLIQKQSWQTLGNAELSVLYTVPNL